MGEVGGGGWLGRMVGEAGWEGWVLLGPLSAEL